MSSVALTLKETAAPENTGPVAGTPRVTFHTCLHDDGDALWLQFEGGTGELAPEMLRLVRGGEVLETRPCIPMRLGRKSHARPDGEFQVTGQGHLRLPALIRHRCGLEPGDRVLLAADPRQRQLVLYPPAVLDDLTAQKHHSIGLAGESV